MSAMFGWCLDGHHGRCPGSIIRIAEPDGKYSTLECACGKCKHDTQQEVSE